MPGLINAHAHSGFLRGTAEHLPVWDWLTLHINPMHRMLQPHEAEAASWLCYAESVLGGTTTVVDMWRFMDGSAKAAAAIGNRLVAVPYVGEHPGLQLFRHARHERGDDRDLASQGGWPHQRLGRARTPLLCRRGRASDAPSSLPKNTTPAFTPIAARREIELAEFGKRYGKRPMFALEELGFFETPRAMIAHGVWLDASEIELISSVQRLRRA